jgi:hypothetical protein
MWVLATCFERFSGKPEPTPEQHAWPVWLHFYMLDKWPRCRCEVDDHFDMCLNCITHRQANDLVN